ncbi:hypothetical protein [Paludisphaera mucosa]|uniref:Uncharacterized protein n=1 Tax=Paludisphaera mucosa TaxID=3030827 RepID=A0ABT6F523_9BACT|nr:hypothetical protein [Paludisphaera mucosa]MDG3002675.1 hypothetical protein [Paludisphaera mucosa]
MDHPGRPNLGRTWILVASAIAGLFSLAPTGQARAAGCHSAERPVLSRAASWDLWDLDRATADVAEAPAPAAVRPLPCGGETPSRVIGDAPPSAAAAAPVVVAFEPAPVGPAVRPAAGPTAPRNVATPPERPPRPA